MDRWLESLDIDNGSIWSLTQESVTTPPALWCSFLPLPFCSENWVFHGFSRWQWWDDALIPRPQGVPFPHSETAKQPEFKQSDIKTWKFSQVTWPLSVTVGWNMLKPSWDLSNSMKNHEMNINKLINYLENYNLQPVSLQLEPPSTVSKLHQSYNWCFRNPAITTWDVQNLVNNGINYQPQLVFPPDFCTINMTCQHKIPPVPGSQISARPNDIVGFLTWPADFAPPESITQRENQHRVNEVDSQNLFYGMLQILRML